MVIDIIVLIVLLISAFIAFLRGFIREVLTIAGVGGGLVAAYYGGPKLAPMIKGWLGVEEGVAPEKLFGIVPYDILGDALAYGAVFIIVVIALSIVSHMLAEGVKNLGLGAVDRSMGVVFGIVRGMLLLGVLYLPVYMLVEQETKDEWFSGSKTHFYLEKTSEKLHGFLPEGTKEKIEEDGEKLKDVKSARETLEGINLLNDDTKNPQEPKQGEGYDDKFREKMDDLFEEKTDINGGVPNE